MFPLGLFLIAAAVWFIDSGVRNRHPIGTIRDIVSDPKHARQHLQESAGTWAAPITPETASMIAGTGPSLTPGAAGMAVAYAKAQVGKPYKWGAVGPNAFDCSGLIYAAYTHAGIIAFPRTTVTQMAGGIKVTKEQLRPGDLIFPKVGHVMLYIGNGQAVEAPRTGKPVHITPIYAFLTARRYVT